MDVGTVVAAKIGSFTFAARITAKENNAVLGAVYELTVPGFEIFLTPAAVAVLRQVVELRPERRDELAYWIPAKRSAIDQAFGELQVLLSPTQPGAKK